MPFKSEKQRRYLWANEPEIAREWTDRYGASQGGLTRLPFYAGTDVEDVMFSGIGREIPNFFNVEASESLDLNDPELTTEIKGLPDIYNPYRNYGQFFRNQPTDERNMLTGLQEKGSGIVDFLMNKGTGLRQGLSLANENYLMPAVAGLMGIANRYNPLRKGSQNYNPDLQNQIDMLKASGHLGGGDPSGPYKITSGPLAGKNLVSAFGTNDYGRMLDKKLAYFQKRKDDKKSYSQKLWDDAKKEKERIEKEKQKSGTNIGGGWTRHDTGGGRATFTGSGGQTHQGYSNTQAGYGKAASEWGSS